FLRRGLRPQLQHHALSISSVQEFLTMMQQHEQIEKEKLTKYQSGFSFRSSPYLSSRPHQTHFNYQQENHSTHDISSDRRNPYIGPNIQQQQQDNNYRLCYQSTGPLDGGVSVNLIQYPSPLHFIHVPVNNRLMEILVDTGATNSIIHQSALLKIQHQPYYPVQQQFFLANQTSIMIKGYVNLEIKIQHIKTFVTAAVTTTLCCDVILGEDWINHYRVIIDRFKNKLEILGNKASVHLRTSSDSKLFSPSSIALKTTNDSVVHNYKNYKPMMKHCLSKRSHFINTLKNSSPQTPHVIQDIEKTIDEMIQHITDLSHKNK
ncbi:unnamed protein product, partial [Rotaria magnacalcarata]